MSEFYPVVPVEKQGVVVESQVFYRAEEGDVISANSLLLKKIAEEQLAEFYGIIINEVETVLLTIIEGLGEVAYELSEETELYLKGKHDGLLEAKVKVELVILAIKDTTYEEYNEKQ